MKYQTKISRSINDIDKERWDSIADHCFTKSETLKIVENLDLCKDAYYLEVLDNEKLVGFAVFYGQTKTLYDNLEESLYGKFNKLVKPVLGLNPALICYFPYSPFYEMFKFRKGYNKKEIFEIITEELRLLAIEENYKSYGFLGVEDEDLTKTQQLLIPVFSGFKIKILVKGKTFEEQIAANSQSRRRTIRKDRKHFLNSEYSIERLKKLEKNEKKIFKILDNNLEKYGGNSREEKLYKEFLKALDKNSQKVTYFVGKEKNKIKSVLVVIEDESRVIGLKAGQAKKEKQGFAFYNTSIYEPVIYAIENFKTELELGTGNYRYKTRRGADLNNSYNLIKATNSIKNLYLTPIMNMVSKRNWKKHVSRLDKEELVK